jgi:phospholipid transport system substrate-binding protein
MGLRRFGLLLLAVLALGLAAGPTWAGEAEDVVRQFSGRLLDVMKDGPKLGFAGRAEKMRPAVLDCYDMAAMVKTTLGSSAAKLSEDETKRLLDAYINFSVATYAAQFDDWEGERLDVGDSRPSTAGAVIVPSWIVPKTGEPTSIDYVMRQDQGRWRVVDVLYDGAVSQVAVRRSEFGSILRAKGINGLIETIEKQTAQLEKK